MAKRADITPELCRQLLRYEPETGKLFWKVRPREMFATQRHCSVWNSRYAGAEAFTAKTSHGYYTGRIMDIQFAAHRVAWAISHEFWPESGMDVDHIDGNKTDNRLANLRCVSHLENGRNVKRPTTNTSGHVGVSWNSSSKSWEAYIGSGPSRRRLGLFRSKNAACTARTEAQKLEGYHRNHGR